MSKPEFSELFRAFGRIGLLSFGGPAAQISLMHEELVTKRAWLSEEQFLRALSLCMLLPGPEAMQLATYAGWRLRGVAGGLLGGLLFVIPGAIVITILACLYINFGTHPIVQASFTGVKAAVIIVVLQALFRLSRKALSGPSAWLIACATFVGLFAIGIPYPALIAAAGLYGAYTAPPATQSTARLPDAPRPFRTVAIWGGLWALPVIFLVLSDHSFLEQIALFFSTLAVVTFGGAYAVLAYMTQTIVQEFGWLTTGQMIDALGMAETTPGPLILVTQFVAFLAGHAQGGWAMALIAAGVTLWVTFIPCFLLIFLAGPYLEVLSNLPRFDAALRAITAAVVGVILNLSLWFALHVWFGKITQFGVLPVPAFSSLDLSALGLTFLAGALMIGRGMSLLWALLTVAAAGALVQAIV